MKTKLCVSAWLLISYLPASALAEQARYFDDLPTVNAPYILQTIDLAKPGDPGSQVQVLIIPHPITPALDATCIIYQALGQVELACPEHMSGFYSIPK